MPHRSNQPAHRRPEAVATLPRPDPVAADRLLSTLADVAIDQMLAPAPPRTPAAPRRPVMARPARPVEDPGDVRLSPEEQAALRGDETDVDDPPPDGWADDSQGMDSAEATTAMPTDDELAALLGEPDRGGRSATGRRSPPATLTDAAAQLAAELDEEFAPPRMRPLEPVLPSRHDLADDDGDAIQAEGAIEDRGGVNKVEPVAAAPEVLLLEGPVPPAHCPLWMLPLVWLNAPLSGASQGVRQTIGKAAVLTFLNAAAVLIYVLTLRR